MRKRCGEARSQELHRTGATLPRSWARQVYDTRLRWSGSTGLGWDHYEREHSASAPPAEQELRLTTGESKGDPAVLNPEQLLVMAASSCQMLWFLHLAAKARIDVVSYEDEAQGRHARRPHHRR